MPKNSVRIQENDILYLLFHMLIPELYIRSIQMAQEIFTFSLRQSDTKGTKTVKRAKELCKKNGWSFSFIVIKALKEHLARLELLTTEDNS